MVVKRSWEGVTLSKEQNADTRKHHVESDCLRGHLGIGEMGVQLGGDLLELPSMQNLGGRSTILILRLR